MTLLRSIVAGLSAATAVSAAGNPYSAYTAGNQQSYLEKQFEQTFYDGYSILKHYGGNGPYSDRISYGIGRDPPESCAVDQVIMISRHGERYPDPSVYKDFVVSLDKVYGSNITNWKGDLAFLNDWTNWITDESLLAQETWQGPYAGLLTAHRHGSAYFDRYGYLWDGESILPIWTSGYERVIQTARKFGESFFGYNYSTNAAINIISENATWGANSLTPECTHDNDTATCNALTYLMPQFYVAADRLNKQNPGLNLNATDAYTLMQLAAFELNARPFSKWIGAFTLDDWVSFGYTQDLDYYYCSGPGDKNMIAVGQVYVNATTTLLNQGPKQGTIYFSFSHDTNITPIIAALGILTPEHDLPLNSIPFGNPWSTGNIVPMTGHLTIERLACNATAATAAGTYVRLVLNEAVVPVPSCQDGPGYSCSLANYTALYSKLPGFTQTCGTPASYPQSLSFFWNYTTSTSENYQQGPIPYQAGAINS